MQQLFNEIVSNGVKDNTYKFALMKFLLDYSHKHKHKHKQYGDIQIVYEDIANKFLEYYWFQECKYKLKQDFKIKRMPMVIRIIRKYCGEEYIPYSYEKYFKNRQNLKKEMIKEIEKNCLQDVIPRLQPKGCYTLYEHFHTLNTTERKYKLPPKDKRFIIISLDTYRFFKNNYHELSKILIYEWAKFLEKTNFTPRLISKIENLGLNNRSSLTKYKNILLKQMESKCFYCDKIVDNDDIHVDHFIPWSYVYEDSIWNLVISCSTCNLKKSDYLAPKDCVQKIEDRNTKYKLNDYNRDVMEYYINCGKAGFISLETLGNVS